MEVYIVLKGIQPGIYYSMARAKGRNSMLDESYVRIAYSLEEMVDLTEKGMQPVSATGYLLYFRGACRHFERKEQLLACLYELVEI